MKIDHFMLILHGKIAKNSNFRHFLWTENADFQILTNDTTVMQ